MGKLTNKWETHINKLFKGKTIKSIRYLTKKEFIDCFGDYGSSKIPVIIEFTDGQWMFPMQDDEGNDGGALATSYDKELPIIPVM